MPVPLAVARVHKRFTNKLLIHLAGHGPFVELEHVGRRSGRVYRIPLGAFRHGDTVTLVLTYGPRVDWYRNLRAAGGGRIRMGRAILTLGPPRVIASEVGLARLPGYARVPLRLARVTDFIALRVLVERTF